MQSQATTVKQYLAELPEDRRETVSGCARRDSEEPSTGLRGRDAIWHDWLLRATQPVIPPDTIAIRNNRSHLRTWRPRNTTSRSICTVSTAMKNRRNGFVRHGRRAAIKLNMGKSCVRFRSLDEVPLKVIGQAIKRVPVAKFIATYEAATGERRASQRKTGAKKVSSKISFDGNKVGKEEEGHPVQQGSETQGVMHGIRIADSGTGAAIGTGVPYDNTADGVRALTELFQSFSLRENAGIQLNVVSIRRESLRGRQQHRTF